MNSKFQSLILASALAMASGCCSWCCAPDDPMGPLQEDVAPPRVRVGSILGFGGYAISEVEPELAPPQQQPQELDDRPPPPEGQDFAIEPARTASMESVSIKRAADSGTE